VWYTHINIVTLIKVCQHTHLLAIIVCTAHIMAYIIWLNLLILKQLVSQSIRIYGYCSMDCSWLGLLHAYAVVLVSY